MPTINVRWADNTKELKANLQSGVQTIEATRASVDKLVKAFAGENLIQAAHKWAAAIQEIGGISKLTASEQERANAVFQKAADKLTLLGKGGTYAAEQFKQLAAQTQKVSEGTLDKWLGNVSTQITATVAGFVSAQAVIGTASTAWHTFTGFVQESLKSYAAAEASATKLTAALRAQGMATPAVAAQYAALSDQFQRTTVYSDDLIVEMEALLVQVGNVMPSQMARALDAATNLASGLGIDLESATTLVAKAAAGHTETLGRYGITVDQAAVKTRGLDAVLEAINKQFGGQAAAQVDTYAGRVAQLANAWDNVKEAVGKAIANDPLIAQGLRSVAAAADDASRSDLGLADSLKEVFGLLPGGFALQILVDHYERLAKEANAAADAQERQRKFQESNKPAASHETETERQERAAAALAKQRAEQAKRDAESAKAAEEYARALKAVNEKIAAAEAPVTALSNAQQRLILHFRELGLTNDEIALKMRLSEKSVTTFTDALDETARAIRNIKETTLSGPIAGLRLYDATADVAELTKFWEKLQAIEAGTFRPKTDPAMLTGPIAGLTLSKPDFEAVKAQGKSLGEALTDAFAQSLSRVPDILKAAFTGGGGVSGALKAQMVDLGASIGSVIANSLSKSITASLSGAGGVGRGEQAASVGMSSGAALAGTLATSGMSAGTATTVGSTIAVSATTAAVTMGISLAVIGAIALYKKYHQPEWAKLGKDIGRDFGINLSEEALKAFEKDSKKFGRQVAELLHLKEIFDADGGVTPKNFNLAADKLHDVFSMIQKGQLTIAQGAKIIDENWAELLAAGTDEFGFVGGKIKDLISLNERFGTQSKEIAAFLRAQGEAAQGAFNAIASGILGDSTMKAWGDLKTSIDDDRRAIADLEKEGKKGSKEWLDATNDLNAALAQQSKTAKASKQSLDDLGIIALSTFAAAIESGKTFAEALAAAAPGLNQLEEAFDALGISTDNAALKALLMQSKLLKNNPQLIQGVSGLASGFAALSNMGMLNKDTFAAMQRTGVEMYTRIQGEVAKTGGSSKDALLPMQGYLHAAQEAAEAYGYELDEATQNMIKDSKEAGIWKEKKKSAIELQTDAIGKLIDKIDTLIRRLLGIPDVDFDVTQHDHVVTDGPGGSNDPNGPNPSDGSGSTGGASGGSGSSGSGNESGKIPGGPTVPAATGGIVRDGYLQRFVGGGFVLDSPSSLRPPNASDTQLVWTSPGELIMTEGQQGRVAGALASALALTDRDRGVQVGSVVVHMTVTENVDADQLEENLVHVLRTKARAYQAVATIAQREVAP